jgi:hypothetical protein
MSERILTLRSRRSAAGLAVGMLLGSPKGRVVYRVVEVTRLRRAGEVQSPRLRIICRRLQPGEAPHGVEIHPWPKDAGAPRPRQERLQAPARRPPTEMALAIAAGRRSERRRPKPVVHHYGGVDVGPTLRLEAVIDPTGTVIREADVSIATVRDPAQPQRIIRRAVRADPLDALERAGSITGREVEAAELLRASLEALTPPLGQTGGMAVQTSPFLRSISAVSLEACCVARQAAAALGRLHWEAVLWVCLGGSVSGYAAYRRMRLAAAGERVRTGMQRLANHLDGVGA